MESLLDRYVNYFSDDSRTKLHPHILDEFCKALFTKSANTRKAYMTDIYKFLAVKFFVF